MGNFITQGRWGAKSLIALYVSVLSGLVLALQYEPATPYFSASAIEVLIPFGAFWRSCHFYSSQLFFLSLLLHLFAIILQRFDTGFTPGKWLLLLGTLPLSLLLLFSGYVLRADATGEAAGMIAENITLSMPLLGEGLNSLFFAIEAEGMKRVYANHLIGFGLFWGICAWEHLRRYRVSLRAHTLWLAAMLLFSLLVAAPMEPARLGVFHIQGPWFFLGLQELLRYLPALWAGVLYPSLLLMALVAVAWPAWRRKALLFAALWLGSYLLLSLVGALR